MINRLPILAGLLGLWLEVPDGFAVSASGDLWREATAAR